MEPDSKARAAIMAVAILACRSTSVRRTIVEIEIALVAHWFTMITCHVRFSEPPKEMKARNPTIANVASRLADKEETVRRPMRWKTVFSGEICAGVTSKCS